MPNAVGIPCPAPILGPGPQEGAYVSALLTTGVSSSAPQWA